MNNKILAAIFLILLGIFAGTKLFKGDRDVNFNKVFTSIDTSKVTEIIIHPKSDGESFSIKRIDGEWQVEQGDVNGRASTYTVQSMLNTIARIEIQRLIANSKDRWADYEVDDVNGQRIEVYNKGKKIEDFVVGRFNFDQQYRTATSYIRKSGEDEIYSLDGFLSMSLNQSFDALRDKTLLKLNTDDLAKITVKQGSNESTLEKNNNMWLTDSGMRVDSSAITDYLNNISNLSGKEISDDVSANQMNETASISFVENASEPKIVYIHDEEGTYYITSTLNPNVIFTSDSTGVVKNLWFDLKSIIE